jgi:hypothetical protein
MSAPYNMLAISIWRTKDRVTHPVQWLIRNETVTMGFPILEALDLERKIPNLPCGNESTIANAIDLERAFPNAARSRSPNSVRVAASEKDKRAKLRHIRRRLLFRVSQSNKGIT